MYSPPFHRRILPWIFVAVFFIAAPVLIFYTAGYRWNPKKDRIERNGTLILDSQPSDAHVFLNNQNTNKTTPITLQDVPPGKYQILLAKDGYRDWQKKLDVRPELVTFANDVTLWKNALPTLVSPIMPVAMKTTSSEKALVIAYPQNTSTAVALWTPTEGISRTSLIPASSNMIKYLDWSNEARALTAEFNNGLIWLVTPREQRQPILIPQGSTRWTTRQLIDVIEKEALQIDIRTARVSHTPINPPLLDQNNGLSISRVFGTEQLVIENGKQPAERYLLPPGNWRFSTQEGKHILLKDHGRWLSVNLNGSATDLHSLDGEELQALIVRNTTKYLALENGEIWLWSLGEEAELLLRQSTPFVDAIWQDERNVIVADKKDVWILNLDQRDGRLKTTLATFDEVRDIAILKTKLYISGTRGGTSGIWELDYQP